MTIPLTCLINVKMDLGEGVVWTGLLWLRIGTCEEELLLMR
jgi:hypothetical protein